MKINIKKTGISLIVLVITIIIMIILAATIIISLENAGIIKTAHNAVCMTNIKQAQNLAVLVWSNVYTNPDEYTMDNVEQKLKEEFEKNGLKYEDYNVEVTKNGIEVSSKAGCIDSGDNTVATEWSYAYTYSESAGWSNKITNVGEEPSGDIVVKLYKTGKKIKPADLPLDATNVVKFPENDGYKMVVSGDGAIPATLDETTGTMSVWTNNMFSYVIDQLQSETKTVVADETFYVTEAVIEEGITSIGDGVFEFFFSLTHITIPTSVTRIDNVGDVDNLEETIYLGSYEQWDNISIGSGNDKIKKTLKVFEWQYAYTYSESTGWSGKITNVGKEPAGDVIVKLYKRAMKITPPSDGLGTPLPEGNAYTMIISGKGNMGALAEEPSGENKLVRGVAWQKEILDYYYGETTVPSEMFYVVEAKIEEGITNIPDFCFLLFRSLPAIIVPDGVETIGQGSIALCDSLRGILLPKSIISIGKAVIGSPYTDVFEAIYYKGTEDEWKKIIIDTNNEVIQNSEKIYNYDD